MSRRLDELALRRAGLIARAAEQRAALSTGGSALLPAGGLGDRLQSVGRVAMAHPVCALVVGVAVGVIVIRRGRAALWAGRAWMAWRAWQAAQVWLRHRATGPD